MCFLDVSCFSSISNPSCNASLVVHSHRMCLCGGSVLPKCQARSKEIVEQKDRWDLPNRSLAYQWLSCCPVIFQTDPDRGGGVNFELLAKMCWNLLPATEDHSNIMWFVTIESPVKPKKPWHSWQEKLGYSTIVKGAGTLAQDAFYALMGCRSPLDGANRGCSGDTTLVHINLEAWRMGYAEEFDKIQAQYPEVAPKLAGSMGFLEKKRSSVFFGERFEFWACFFLVSPFSVFILLGDEITVDPFFARCFSWFMHWSEDTLVSQAFL